MAITPVNSQSVMSQGLQGMQKSSREMAEAAHEIANAGTQETPNTTMDIAEPMIEMKIEQNVFDASAQVVKTADEMIGALIDIKA